MLKENNPASARSPHIGLVLPQICAPGLEPMIFSVPSINFLMYGREYSSNCFLLMTSIQVTGSEKLVPTGPNSRRNASNHLREHSTVRSSSLWSISGFLRVSLSTISTGRTAIAVEIGPATLVVMLTSGNRSFSRFALSRIGASTGFLYGSVTSSLSKSA